MADFSFLKPYVVVSKDAIVSPASKHVFYPVNVSQILEAEQKMGFLFPDELDDLYKQIGYGFLNHNDKRENFNRLMPPASVASIYLREEPYASDPDMDVYEDKDQLLFFELSEGLYLSLNLKDKGNISPVYYFEDKVANSIAEFIHQYEQNPDFLDDYE